jgi:predicted cupin superfamily sugar epimerase
MTGLRDARLLIEQLQLEPHPEGGWFRETYRSPGEIPAAALPEGYTGGRAFSTAVYFLLAGEEFSAFHRIRSDELWHFHAGSDLLVHVLSPGGDCRVVTLGDARGRAGVCFQAAVPAGTWFAAELRDKAGYALVGCTVAPGFDFRDFELADTERLAREFPGHEGLIRRLTAR